MRLSIFACALATCARRATADDDGGFTDTLAYKEASSLAIAAKIETLFDDYQNNPTSSCYGYNDCADALPSGTCDVDFGATEGCSCTGRSVDTRNAVTITRVAAAEDVKNAVCYTDGLDAALEDLYTSEESELKWMYYGTAEGVLINYPGLLSPRGTGETGGLLDCSGDYDPRQRAWYVMGAAGPKDVILIIDKSGSMSKYGRMSNAKAAATLVVNSLTNIDFVSVVTFSTVAGSPNTMLVRAEAAYRAQMVSDIADINESGYTYYVKALTAAFDITNTSDTPGSAGYAYNSGCTRVYIFLTDGDPTDELAEFQTSLEAHLRSTDMFFFVALGDGIDAATTSDIQTIVCAVGGIYLAVADNDAAALDTAMASYYQYLALGAMVAEVQPTRWSEPYVSSPDIWGDVVSAVTPVFDKRDIGGVGAWTLIGVAAVDLPLCELVDAADAVGWDDDSTDDYASQTTKQGCSCERSYTYESVTYTSCTSYDWSSPWCAVEEGCGFELDAVSTTGHWDECDTSASVEGKVRLALRERSNVCYATELSSAALEALRGAYACASTSGGGSDDDEWESVLVTPNAFSCDDDGDAACAWEKSGYGDLQGDLCEGEYNTDACYECNSAMRPSCSYSECVAALAEFPPGDDDRGACANDEMGDDSVVGGGAIGLVIVVGVIVAVLVVGGVVGMLVMRMQKPAATTTMTGSAARSPAAAVEMHAVQSTAPPPTETAVVVGIAQPPPAYAPTMQVAQPPPPPAYQQPGPPARPIQGHVISVS